MNGSCVRVRVLGLGNVVMDEYYVKCGDDEISEGVCLGR